MLKYQQKYIICTKNGYDYEKSVSIHAYHDDVFGLTACGGGEEQTDPVETEDSSVEEEEAAEEEETEEPEKKEEEADTGDTDVSSAIEESSTSETEAVPLGQWAKVADYATEDEAYHTVYVRVTKVTTSEADEAYVQSSIETNNTNSSEYGQINTADIELPDDVELCVLDYEVFVPEDSRHRSMGWWRLRWISPRRILTAEAYLPRTVQVPTLVLELTIQG